MLAGMVVLLWMSGNAAGPARAAGLDAFLTGGSPRLAMRLRYEMADDRTDQPASALTLRTRLGYETARSNGLSAFIGFEDVRTVAGVRDYAPLQTGFATIADPPVTQLDQAWFSYRPSGRLRLRLGRQRIVYDNARFVGNVGWRQNEQTFDALSVRFEPFPAATFRYAFIDRVAGILPRFDADVSDHLLNLGYRGLAGLDLTAYAYLLEDDDDGRLTENTAGARLSGRRKMPDGVGLGYRLELARQETDDFTAGYAFVEGRLDWLGTRLGLAYERLGSDGGRYGFQTRLATKHAFNGWADLFLATPDAGLRDWMLDLSCHLGGMLVRAVYHDFSADEGGQDYGAEFDLMVRRRLGERYVVGAKYAAYRAETFKTDTDRFWLWVSLRI